MKTYRNPSRTYFYPQCVFYEWKVVNTPWKKWQSHQCELIASSRTASGVQRGGLLVATFTKYYDSLEAGRLSGSLDIKSEAKCLSDQLCRLYWIQYFNWHLSLCRLSRMSRNMLRGQQYKNFPDWSYERLCETRIVIGCLLPPLSWTCPSPSLQHRIGDVCIGEII